MVGPTNSGKTLSALLLSAGLMPGAKIGVIDTERGRASLYADNRRVLAALPQGYDVIELDAPYTPKRYVEAIDLLEKKGYDICIPDSFSDAWDGSGGCCDIAEEDNNKWNRAKRENKRLMNRVCLSTMHMLCCFKAQEKTKIVPKEKSASGKQEYIDRGMQPITEKNNFFPFTFRFMFDAETHLATMTKVHDDIADKFKEPRLMTPKDGEIIRLWQQGGASLKDNELLLRRGSEAAAQGMSYYKEFFDSLGPDQRKAVQPHHEANKKAAMDADIAIAEREKQEATA